MIRKILKENNVKIRDNKKLTNDEEIQIVNFYNDGLSMSTIGDKMDIPE